MATESRGAWGSQLQFILTCVGFSVGLGNLWRFPATAYENGGAAFVIPYVVCSVLVGLPCLYLEFLIGQLTQSGPSKAFRCIMPAMQVYSCLQRIEGVGWAMSLTSLLTGIYYNVVVAWCLSYIFDVITFQSTKWTSCNNMWNTKNCFNGSGPALLIGNHSALAAQEFFDYRMFKKDSSIEHMGAFNWEIFRALLAAWIITCLSLIRGVALIGKISFLTATLPYIIIVIMLVRGVTMDGAKIGVDYFLLRPDLSKIWMLKTWVEAAKQLCFSLSIGFGGLLALASYNKRGHNCFRDAIIVVVCDGLMSLIGGVAVFSVIGALSKSSGESVKDLFQHEATSITFVTYPQAISLMPASVIFEFLFFFMFFLLGISSQFGSTQNVVTTVTDQFPSLRKWNEFVVAGFCSFSLLVGLIMCSKSGYRWFLLFYNSIAGTAMLILCLIELALCIFIYGRSNLLRDIKENLVSLSDTKFGRIFGPSGFLMSICWTFVTPVALLIIVVLGIMDDRSVTKNDKSLLLEYLPLIAIPIFTIVNVIYFIKQGKGWREAFRVRKTLTSSSSAQTNSKVRPQEDDMKNGWREEKF